MKKERLDECISEAQRFLDKAMELKKQEIGLRRAEPDTERYQHLDSRLSKYTAQVRRASLDLTHSLAALRQER